VAAKLTSDAVVSTMRATTSDSALRSLMTSTIDEAVREARLLREDRMSQRSSVAMGALGTAVKFRNSVASSVRGKPGAGSEPPAADAAVAERLLPSSVAVSGTPLVTPAGVPSSNPAASTSSAAQGPPQAALRKGLL
jgi:hypothetical protein